MRLFGKLQLRLPAKEGRKRDVQGMQVRRPPQAPAGRARSDSASDAADLRTSPRGQLCSRVRLARCICPVDAVTWATDAVTRKGGKRELIQAKPGNPSPPDGSRRLHMDPHVWPQAGRGAGDGERAATPGCASGLTCSTPSPRLPVAGQRGDLTTACPATCRQSCSPCSGAPAQGTG